MSSVPNSKTKLVHILNNDQGHPFPHQKKVASASLIQTVPPETKKRSTRVKTHSTSHHRKIGTTPRKKRFKDILTNYEKMASRVLTAYMAFRNPAKRKRDFLIPKDKAAWLDLLVTMAKRHINIEFLTDKELKKVIIRARPNLSPYKKPHQGPVVDPDLPPCLDWSPEEVGEWIESCGWPHLKETFVRNYISGRRLIMIDCAALNKMGMTDLASMREVAGKIRELLEIPPPNQIRAIMRVSPYEHFLHRKIFNGRGYDELTFEKFCENEGYNYEIIRSNKNAQISCTTEVMITTPDLEDEEEDIERESDDHSLKNAPTVEFLVRNAIIRNQKVEELMADILESVFVPPSQRIYGKEMWGSLKRGIGEGYDDLHLHYPKDKLEFASGVAHALLDELFRTVEVMNDISQLETHIQQDMTQKELELFRTCAQTLINEATPIVSLLALGELDLETIFKQEPEFQEYVDGIIRDTEQRANDLVPEATSIIDEVIEEAFSRIPSMDLSGLTPEQKRSILRMANGMLKGVGDDASSTSRVRVEVKKAASGISHVSQKHGTRKTETSTPPIHTKKAPPTSGKLPAVQATQSAAPTNAKRKSMIGGRPPRGHTTTSTTTTKSKLDKED